MLYGTELDGSDLGGGFAGAPLSVSMAEPEPAYALPRQPAQVKQQLPAVQPVVQQPRYTPQQVAMLQQQAQQQQVQQYQPRYGPSYFEQLWSSRREISKLLMLAIIVVTGLSIHGCGKHVLKHVMADREMTFNQELLIRAAYPAIMLFTAWNLRLALQASKW